MKRFACRMVQYLHGEYGRLEPPKHFPCAPLTAYFLRRLLLIPFTLLGMTLLVFVIMRMVPGGPMEEALKKQMGSAGEKGQSAARSREQQGGSSLTPAVLLELEEKYDRDKPMFRAYAEWLGILPNDDPQRGNRIGVVVPEGKNEVMVPVPGTIDEVKVTLDGQGGFRAEPPPGMDFSKWRVKVQSPQEQKERWDHRLKGKVLLETLPQPRVVLYRPGFDGLLEGSLGTSRKYQEPVWQMIAERLPVSGFYALFDIVLVYIVCLPLGILKAIKHRTWIDNFTSVVVFAGYAVPGYALGSVLVVFLGARLGWFPLGGFTGDDFPNLGAWDKLKDLGYHAVLPLICYMIGSFAVTTLMTKNNLMDNLAADYVRTAVSKGMSFRRAVFRHAVRNSLIPVAATFGSNIALIVGGSILIEKIFDINGFGLLQFNSVLEADDPVVMGLTAVSGVLVLLGNVISDLCVALVDPRVSYK